MLIIQCEMMFTRPRSLSTWVTKRGRKTTSSIKQRKRFIVPNLVGLGTIILALLIYFIILQKQKLLKFQSTGSTSSISLLSVYHDDIFSIEKTNVRACYRNMYWGKNIKKWFKSQSKEDRYIMELFASRACYGTYIEMGALDGIEFSNTFALNKITQWKGVLIELNPTSYVKLLNNRDNELALINAAVCHNTTQILHYWPSESNPAVAGVWEYAADSFRKRWWKDVSINDTTPIQCKPLNNILSETFPIASRYYFDVLSLDCEGCELAALQSIDWDRTAFGVAIIEAGQHTHEKNEAVRELMRKQNYTILSDGIQDNGNDWFIHSNFKEIYRHILN